MDGVANTVFIVDDADEVRAGLSRLLAAAGYKVKSFKSAEAFLKEQNEAEAGCLLLDVLLPGLTGIELQRELAGSPCARPIVFLTGHEDVKTTVVAMKEGAVDFLTKPVEKESLFQALDHALRRDVECRQEHAIRSMIRERVGSLTPRERDVMAHVFRGRLNKQIAAELGIGEKTVKVHRSRVMSKMAVRSVAELVQLGSRIGILTPQSFRPALRAMP
jgi:FixJ family two-component response regulator